MHRITTLTTGAAVRAEMAAAGLGQRLADGAQRRLDGLREEPESGAQAAEYAMLGGVSAAACGGLVYLFKETDALERVVKAVIDVLTTTVGRWF